jgi:hypothetical protein
MRTTFMWMAFFSISPLMAQSSAAASNSEANSKAQASAPVAQQELPTFSKNLPQNPCNYTDAELNLTEAWLIAADDETVTVSHALHNGKVMRNIVFPRSFFRETREREKWYLAHVKAHRRLFEDADKLTSGEC